MRILVVDDEESLREVLSEVLTDDGYPVTTAATAEEALAAFGADPYPVVISDIRMPGMDGITLLERIKAMQEETQVIIITSHASLDSAVTALRAGAYDYLIKPFEDLNLISAVVARAADKVRLVVENRVLVEKLKRYNQELEAVNQVLRELAIRDGLTGLYNHRYFQERLAVEVARSHRGGHQFSLVFLDVDYFKTYNDTHGHPTGDELLRGVSEMLQRWLRKSDLAARYGGEEFVILLPETDKAGARELAERIRREIAEHPFAGRESQPSGRVTVSMGVASYPEDGRDAREILKRADEVLYQAKHGGRDRVCA
ncbi:MAG TPA: diguanylate cyclase [Gammaproteobacteria bacterium]|nr:diguanylate cyclase [Gammaproteobacteria bacterium]